MVETPIADNRAGGGIAAVFLDRRDLVRRLLVAQGCPPDQAEDILQDMWLKIGRARIGPVADPVAYLMRMASNLAADRRVAAQRRSARELGWSEVQPRAAEQPDPEREAMAASELARMQALLDAMPAPMRRALVLFRIEGWSQAAIAADAGLSVSGIEKLLARAVRRLVEFHREAPLAAPHSPADAGDRDESHG